MGKREGGSVWAGGSRAFWPLSGLVPLPSFPELSAGSRDGGKEGIAGGPWDFSLNAAV